MPLGTFLVFSSAQIERRAAPATGTYPLSSFLDLVRPNGGDPSHKSLIKVPSAAAWPMRRFTSLPASIPGRGSYHRRVFRPEWPDFRYNTYISEGADLFLASTAGTCPCLIRKPPPDFLTAMIPTYAAKFSRDALPLPAGPLAASGGRFEATIIPHQ